MTDKAHGPLVLQRFLLRTELSNVQITGPSRIKAPLYTCRSNKAFINHTDVLDLISEYIIFFTYIHVLILTVPRRRDEAINGLS